MEDASLQARVLCDTLGIFNHHKQYEIARMIEFIARATGDTLELTREKMVAKWAKYRLQRNELQWAYQSPARFFAWDAFNDEDLWPWLERRVEPGIDREVRAESTMSLEEVNALRARLRMPPLKAM